MLTVWRSMTLSKTYLSHLHFRKDLSTITVGIKCSLVQQHLKQSKLVMCIVYILNFSLNVRNYYNPRPVKDGVIELTKIKILLY